jgi:hypothetical protein
MPASERRALDARAASPASERPRARPTRLPAIKVETMRPPLEVAAAIEATLAVDAPRTLPAAWRN